MNKETISLEYKEKGDFIRPNNKINVVIAAYTTAQARLKLYDVLDKLGSRALYCDTDSIHFLSKKDPTLNSYMPILNDYLGGLTSELPAGTYISEFTSSASKSYAYVIVDENGKIVDIVIKIKGLCLNDFVSRQLNHEILKGMVMSEMEARRYQNVTTPLSKKITNEHFITRDKKSVTIRSIKQVKTFQCVYQKRFVMFNCVTVPYGY